MQISHPRIARVTGASRFPGRGFAPATLGADDPSGGFFQGGKPLQALPL